MLCPTCKTAMRAETENQVMYSACPQCAGLWFADGELSKLIRSGSQTMEEVEDTNLPLRSPQLVGSLACPDCGTTLMKYQYAYASPVELDGCESCGGVFLQDGELAAIQKWKSEEATKGDTATAIATMAARIEKSKAKSQRVQELSRVAMMRRSWMTWDTTDVFRSDRDR